MGIVIVIVGNHSPLSGSTLGEAIARHDEVLIDEYIQRDPPPMLVDVIKPFVPAEPRKKGVPLPPHLKVNLKKWKR